ncbi:hypothetical protein BSL78_21134 [Apostichopus japonicus]|uniref:SCAN box domain-containing protein n=1 Tax=Stichopus japonicus TaxID=307972 RepID=A0A2G8K1Y8_STIJA|nr:hypothetical protein BSL78_21134 [Apostichopus japonicus]
MPLLTLGMMARILKSIVSQNNVYKKEENEEKERQIELEFNAKKKLIEAQEKVEQEKANQLEIQLEIQKSKQAEAGNNGYGGNSQTSKGRAPKLPSFNQDRDDIDAYLHRFELYATSQKWNKTTEWATNLGALLQGDALLEYSSLSLQDAINYDKVKTAVLKAYHLTTDGFRKRFREVKPTENETGSRFVTRLTNYLQRWMELEEVGNFLQMQDLILREQFVNCCSKDHATLLKESKPATITGMAKLSDQLSDEIVLRNKRWLSCQK